MSDQEFVIELEDDDAEGHALRRATIEADDTEWLQDKVRRDSGKTSFRLKALDEDDDTEGHHMRGGPVVRVMVGDDDDTEGHAISIHFPSRTEADAFRRRLMVTGVLVGTVALGAAGGVGLSALQSDSDPAGAAGGATTLSQVGPLDAHEAPAFQAAAGGAVDVDRAIGIMDGSGAAAATQAGPMDAHEAPAFQDAGLSAADQAYADRLSGQAAANQVGPLDAHEAPAFQAAAAGEADVNRDIGIMDGSGAAAATQAGPMDAHEAPAFQDAGLSAADQAYADRLSGQAAQSGTTDKDSSELNDIGGPTPR